MSCIFPLCCRPAIRDEFCISHAKHFAKPAPVKEKKKIAFRSAKRELKQKLYVEIVKKMLAENPYCEIKMDGCSWFANGLHHKIKRTEKNLCDKKNLLRACNFCNSALEKNDKWGRENGFVKSKFSIEES